MKTIVHNKRERFAVLSSHFIAANVSVGRVSDVKRDGTVIVSFLSEVDTSAVEATETFGRYLSERQMSFTQVEDNKIRMALPELLSEATSDPFGFDQRMRNDA